MASPLDRKLAEMATQALAVHGLVLVQSRLSGTNGRLTLQIFAEKSDGSGATLEECTAVSRTLSAQLDVAELINSRYNLEVSSPGLDRPLTSVADCQRFIGKTAHFRFAFPHEVPELKQSLGAITGVIQSVENDKIEISIEKTTRRTTFSWKNVRDANLSPTEEEIAVFMKMATSNSSAKSTS